MEPANRSVLLRVASDAHHLNLAARLALRGLGLVEPNPMVGAVLVKDGGVIGLGHHRRFGDLHAERDAIESARRRGHDPAGSTLFVTLEPCRHHGKQPPCTDAIVEAGITRVVYAVADPGEASGSGAEVLRAAGVSVEQTDHAAARAVTLPFLVGSRERRPFVIAKWAQTLDGRVATRTGESKWISSEASRRRVHRLRARVDAILTGIGTVHADDPDLTARGRKVRRVAVRVVADPALEIPVDARLIRSARDVPTIIACREDVAQVGRGAERVAALWRLGVCVTPIPASGSNVDLAILLHRLHAEAGVSTVLVEAGPKLLGSLFEAELVDAAVVYVSPAVLGDSHARGAVEGRLSPSLNDARRLSLVRQKRVDGDLELTFLAIRPR